MLFMPRMAEVNWVKESISARVKQGLDFESQGYLTKLSHLLSPLPRVHQHVITQAGAGRVRPIRAVL